MGEPLLLEEEASQDGETRQLSAPGPSTAPELQILQESMLAPIQNSGAAV